MDDAPMPQMAVIVQKTLSDAPFSWTNRIMANACFRAHIVKCVAEHNKQARMPPEHIQFTCSINNDSYKEIISYHKLMDFILPSLSVGSWWGASLLIASGVDTLLDVIVGLEVVKDGCGHGECPIEVLCHTFVV